MLITSRNFLLGLLGSIALGGTSWAAPGVVQGDVLDVKGKPYAGAEIRFDDAKNPASANKSVKTDAKGHYSFNGLVAGKIYRVSLVQGGSVKAAINNVQPKIGDPTVLNFNMKDKSIAQTASKPGKHKVWMPSETGSHLGGRWVDVDDESPQNMPGVDNVKKGGNDTVRNLQMGGR
jgi:hypothetical protein